MSKANRAPSPVAKRAVALVVVAALLAGGSLWALRVVLQRSAHDAATRAISTQGILIAGHLAGQSIVQDSGGPENDWRDFARLVGSLQMAERGIQFVSVRSGDVTLFHKQPAGVSDADAPLDVLSLTNTFQRVRVSRRRVGVGADARPVVVFSVEARARDGSPRLVEVALKREAVAREERAAMRSIRTMFALSLLAVVLSFAICAALILWMLRRDARRERQRREEEHLAFSGVLANGIVHDFRNPMSAVRLDAQMLQRESARGPECRLERIRDLAERIRKTVDRMDSVFQEFLYLAKPAQAEAVVVDLAVTLHDCLDMLAPRFEAAHAKPRFIPPPGPVHARVHEAGLRRALINVLINAIQFSPPDGVVTVRLAVLDGQAAMEVEDAGPGVPADRRDRLFEMFTTSRPEGTGLGLFLARVALDKFGGAISRVDRPGPGACFRIVVPLASPGKEGPA